MNEKYTKQWIMDMRIDYWTRWETTNTRNYEQTSAKHSRNEYTEQKGENMGYRERKRKMNNSQEACPSRINKEYQSNIYTAGKAK